MTDLATQARAAAEHAEVRFHVRRDHADSGASLLTFEVPSEDLPSCVRDAAPGQRFMLALVPINDDGTPKAVPIRSRGHRLNALAHTICEEREFQRWAFKKFYLRETHAPGGNVADVALARRLITEECDIPDRGKLVGNESACDRFEDLMDQYHRAHGRRYFREIERTE